MRLRGQSTIKYNWLGWQICSPAQQHFTPRDSYLCGVELRRRKIRSSGHRNRKCYESDHVASSCGVFLLVVIPALAKKREKTGELENIHWKFAKWLKTQIQLCTRFIFRDTWSSFSTTSSWYISLLKDDNTDNDFDEDWHFIRNVCAWGRWLRWIYRATKFGLF